MSKFIIVLFVFVVIVANWFSQGCLITNCPRGGKRSMNFALAEVNMKPCLSCGPGHTGQCFGPAICCGPFGCLVGTPETQRCQREGLFNDPEPCIAGTGPCKRHPGRCATDGICCNQESCFTDRSCTGKEKSHLLSDNLATMDLYNLINYQAEIGEN